MPIQIKSVNMTHYSDEQFFFDLAIPQGDVEPKPASISPFEKTLSEHVNSVNECMQRFVKETECNKAR